MSRRDESDLPWLLATSARNRASKQMKTGVTDIVKAINHIVDANKKVKQPKYRNERTKVDGIGFDSKAEARVYSALKMAMDKRKLWFIRQPSFDLPGGVKYRADFLVVEDGKVRVVDVKGFDTQASKNKRKQVAALYGVEVELVK